jgi:hypothetical protein
MGHGKDEHARANLAAALPSSRKKSTSERFSRTGTQPVRSSQHLAHPQINLSRQSIAKNAQAGCLCCFFHSLLQARSEFGVRGQAWWSFRRFPVICEAARVSLSKIVVE